MDRSRQMPNSNEQQSSSDDLIAELARLMAEEAQGTKPAAAPAPAVDKDADSATVVRIPSARPAVQADPAPTAGSAWGRREDTPAPANNDAPAEPAPEAADPFAREAEPAPEPSTPDLGYARAGAPVEPDFGSSQSAPSFAARAETDTGSRFAEPEPEPEPAQAAADPIPEPEPEPAAPADDPIAELIAEQEREEARKAQYAAMPRHVFPDPTPATRPAPVAPRVNEPALQSRASEPEEPAPRFVAPAPAPAEPAPAPVSVRPEPASPTPGAEKSSVDPDVLSLLRSMSAEVSPAPAAKPRTSGGDAFASPIFGGEPAKPARAAAADPLEEIESLIGDAVRLSRDDQPKAEQRVEPQVDLDDAAHRAEAAIAAATAASGRTGHRTPQPELHDPLLDGDGEVEPSGVAPELDRDEVKPAKPRSGRLVIGAAAATILVAVALGLYWVFGGTGGTDGSVPFLASNTSNAKAPVEQNTTSSETSQPAIFNEMDGNGAQAPADEQIVSRDQSTGVTDTATGTSTDAASDTTSPAVATADSTGVGNTTTSVASATDTAASTGIRQVETPEAAEESLANRKVRTVTVRPDGTIVSNDDTLAANEVLPVARPNVPALSGDTAPVTDFQVATTPDATNTTAAASTTTDTVAAPDATNAVDPLASLVSSSVAESDAAAGIDTATAGAELVTDAPYPAAAPSEAFRVASAEAPSQVRAATPTATTTTTTNTIDLIAGAANQVASQLPTATTSAPATAPQTSVATTAPAATAPVVTGPAGPDAPAYVQLSSQRSLDAANATMTTLGEKFRGLFNGAEPFVKQVDLGDRGIYYRVLVPANSLADASGVCSSVKSAGGDCFVRNNN